MSCSAGARGSVVHAAVVPARPSGSRGRRVAWALVVVLLAPAGCRRGDDSGRPKQEAVERRPAEPTGAGGAPEPVNLRFITTHLARLQQGADCANPGSPHGIWCQAATGFATGAPAAIPPGDTVLLGLSTFVTTTGDVRAGLERHTAPATLAFRNAERPLGVVTTIRSNNTAERVELNRVAKDLAGLLRGQTEPISMEPRLASFLEARPAAAKYPVARVSNGWQLVGGTHAFLRKVGAAWVVVEIPRRDPEGMYVTMARPAAIARRAPP